MPESKKQTVESIYTLTKLKENIHLTPRDINNNINDIILRKLKKRLKESVLRKVSLEKIVLISYLGH